MRESTELVKRNEAVESVIARMETIQEVTRRAMTKDVDYGVIPGTQKPTLLMPGAEKLCVLFRLSASFKTTKTFDGAHLIVESTCAIADHDGVFLGEASAICSTRESKYAYRRGSRKCPECGAEAILRSKFPPRENPQMPPGWYCFAKKGGCGFNFLHDDQRITSQSEGRVPNEDLADSYNTVLRISEKRAYVACVRKVTGSSGFFDEEIPDRAEREPEEPKQEPKKVQEKPPANGKLKDPMDPIAQGWRKDLHDRSPGACLLNEWLDNHLPNVPDTSRQAVLDVVGSYAAYMHMRKENDRYYDSGQPTPTEAEPAF